MSAISLAFSGMLHFFFFYVERLMEFYLLSCFCLHILWEVLLGPPSFSSGHLFWVSSTSISLFVDLGCGSPSVTLPLRKGEFYTHFIGLLPRGSHIVSIQRKEWWVLKAYGHQWVCFLETSVKEVLKGLWAISNSQRLVRGNKNTLQRKCQWSNNGFMP